MKQYIKLSYNWVNEVEGFFRGDENNAYLNALRKL